MTPENRTADREVAAHSFVLLTNDTQILPLKKTGNIALVGPFADNKRDMLGTWVIAGEWEKSVSVAEGIKAAAPALNVLLAKGSNIAEDDGFIERLNFFGQQMVVKDALSPETMMRQAVEAARKSDIVVAVLGESQSMSGESSSRSDINLPQSQRALLEELVKTGKPVVLVLFTGRPLTLSWEAQHCAAILNVWAPGTEAGNAIADVLFGTVNPGGKLSATFPRSIGQIPLYYNHKPTGRPFDGTGAAKFKSNYLDSPNEPLYPFGFGLSYTQFEYGTPTVNKNKLKGNETLTLTVPLRNIGKLAGEEVVQLYVRDPVASISRPVKELKGFQKMALNPGESRTVTFTLTPEDLKFYNSELKYDWEAGDFEVMVGGNARDVKSVVVGWEK